MEEIKIGEYIRTKKGLIAKVCAYQDLTTYDKENISVTFHSFDTDKGSIANVEIANHKENILDLIEAGDVLKIEEDNEICYIGLDKDTTTVTYQDIIDSIKNKEVKLLEILTHEQYQGNSYKLE